jgi:5'-phosphate synthase pdxT subunit
VNAERLDAPTIGVLALQGDFAEHAVVLKRLSVEVVEVRLPKQLARLDGLIIPGGESTTIARLLMEWGLLEPIRVCALGGMAVWGTCAGAILLAERADDLDREGLRLMDITVERNAFGRQVDSFEVDLELDLFDPEPFHAVFIRAPRKPDYSSRGVRQELLCCRQGHGGILRKLWGAAERDPARIVNFLP